MQVSGDWGGGWGDGRRASLLDQAGSVAGAGAAAGARARPGATAGAEPTRTRADTSGPGTVAGARARADPAGTRAAVVVVGSPERERRTVTFQERWCARCEPR